MRVFNQNKTTEITEYDLDLGYLTDGKLFVAHYDAVSAVEEQGHYEPIKVYDNGFSDVKWVVDVPAVEAKEAYDEYEDIKVYIPYSAEELEERRLANLRLQRVGLLAAFDKWEKAVLRGRETDDESVMAWYRSLLDLEETAFKTIPERVRYYL